MEIFCAKDSSGCIQEDIRLTVLRMDEIGLQMEFPEGFYQMEEEKRRRFYPGKERPRIILENPDGVQVTGQAAGLKMKREELVSAVEAAREMAADTFPQYRFSPVYLQERGELSAGWFRMRMPDRKTEHIKAFGVVRDKLVMVTFTYPEAEEIKWKSLILYSLGTWREVHGES